MLKIFSLYTLICLRLFVPNYIIFAFQFWNASYAILWRLSVFLSLQEHASSGLSSLSKPNKENLANRSRSPLTIPTIITEDVDSDPKDSPENPTSSSWSPQQNGASAHQAVLKSKPVGVGSNQPRGASLPESGKSTSSAMGSTDAHPTHYHTVHGTSHIGHHHQCNNAAASNHPSTAMSEGGCPGYNCKQRNRSHSGPVYPVAFPQSMRHSALISGGMATLGASSRRRQSDDSEQTSSSLRSRVSPSGSSFFDSFRYVSTYYSLWPYSSGDHCSMTSHFLVISRLCVLICWQPRQISAC